jgi:predicted transport protein
MAVEVRSFPSVNLNNDLIQKNISTQHDYDEYLKGEVLELFEIIRQRILSLDISVREEFKKYYIAYKTITNFVDIYPQKTRLRLILNMNLQEIKDPKNLCKDITGWRMNGDVEVSFSSLSQLEDAMFLIRQAFDKYSNK